MKKMVLMVLLLLTVFILLRPQRTAAKGIIIADDQKILNTFRAQDSQQVKKLAAELKNYDKVILHLGSRTVFERGYPFFFKSSQQNLVIFAEELEKQGQQLYLWFLDSFGSSQFLDIYTEHREIIDQNREMLKQLGLKYEGIVIDLEWINLNSAAAEADNSKKYVEVISYLAEVFSDKELYAFASLIDSQVENIKRGYQEEEILSYLDNIIVMLYLKDGGFELKDGKLKLKISARRVEELRDYYQKHNYQTAVSLTGGVFLERNQSLYFIKTAAEFPFAEKTEELYQKEEKYYLSRGFKAKNNFELIRNDGLQEEIRAGEKIHFLKIKAAELIKEEDYLWEYFEINGD